MSAAALTLDDLLPLVRACDAIQLDGCTPPYLGEFLARRLAASHPELSAKIGQFNAERMELLCKFIKLAQTLTRSPGK
jgi:hypothetical protein